MTISANYPSIRPTLLLDFANTEALDPRITFSRPTTATYYDDNTSVVAEQNLVTQSQTFSTWTTSGALPTANTTTAPDGTTTGTSLIESATTAAHNIFFAAGAVGSTYTQTVYAKANTRNWLKVVNYVTYANFDLTNGVIGSYNTSTAPTITSVGNGWYRCSMTLTTFAASYMQLFIGSGNVASYNDSYAGDGTSGIFIWGAQLEQRSSATAYTPTTTTAITNYIPVLQTASTDTARFDHNPTTRESLGLLIEEQRTNLLTYSDDLTSYAIAPATGLTSTLTSNIAPNGTLTARLLTNTTTTDFHRLFQGVTLVASTAYTYTVYFKNYTAGWAQLSSYLGGSLTAFANFNLSTGALGTVGNCTATITAVGNGWYRCSITATTEGTSCNLQLYVIEANSTTANPSTTGTNKGIFVWGAQLEAGAFATSYIPTVASQVTRSADSAKMTDTNFSSWFQNGSGTLYSEFLIGQTTSVYPVLPSLYNTSTPNTDFCGFYSSSLVTVATGIRVNGILATPLVATIAYSSTTKATMSFSPTSVSISANGGAVSTGSLENGISSNLNAFNIGGIISGYFQGISYIRIKKIAYYPIALTNTNLTALTGS
jgi:hypothetical protein